MTTHAARSWRMALIWAVLVAAVGGSVPKAPAVAAAPAAASAPAAAVSAAPVRAGSRYLALGDSVTFGYRERTNLPAPDYGDATTFAGYPEYVGADLSLTTTNAACPGETSASFIDSSAPSNWCESAADGTGPGYRTDNPLHVAYQESQLAFAVRYLRLHRDTRLVSLMIGANDRFLCQATTRDRCATEMPAVLARIAANTAAILYSIRADGQYSGQIIIVNYYSLNYSRPGSNAQSQSFNRAMDSAARPYGVAIADVYRAFEKAAQQAEGDSCAAGLLTILPNGRCGLHPSVAGQQLLAGAVERAIVER